MSWQKIDKDNMSRGESRISHLSQISESTVLNQDFGELSALEQDFLVKGHSPVGKISHFQNGLESVKDFSTSNDHLVRLATRGAAGINMAERLKERLYCRPENSDVLHYVRHQTAKKIVAGRPVQLAPLQRPPSAKQNKPQIDAFCTTICKRDYLNHQKQLKEPKEPSGFQKILCKHADQSANKTVTKEQIVHSYVQDVNLESHTGITATGKKTEVIQTLKEVDSKVSVASIPDAGIVGLVRGPNFSNPQESEEDDRDDPNEDLQEDKNNQHDGLIPIIEKFSPDIDISASRTSSERKQRLSLASLYRAQSAQPSNHPPLNTSGSARCIQSAKRAHSGRMDMSKVLSYLKKNKYDDTIPDNDSAYDNLLDMRKRLGWDTNIPRHGPACKKEMYKLSDFPKDEKEVHLVKNDDGQFLYCLPRNRDNPRGRYEPYDLQVVSANTARTQCLYWTVSASYITLCDERNGKVDQSSATPVLWWLWERRLFYMVYHFPVFVKFRLWKAFNLWRYCIRHQKNSENQALLYKTLFMANEVLQGCIIHVQSLCETAKGTSKDGGTILLVDLDSTKTLSLQDFQRKQELQCDKAFQMMTALREKVIELVWESCATVAEMEGITQGIRGDSPRKVTIQPSAASGTSHPKMLKNGSTRDTDQKEKKKLKPLYAEIAEWRKILARLACFLRAVDYSLQELLRHLVFSSVQKLLDHLVTSYQAHEENDENEREQDSRSHSDITSSRESSAKIKFYAPDTPTFTRKDKKEGTTQKGYVIPHYDFDQVEKVEGPPDIDDVLEEIRQRDIVEEIISPVFFISLVLNVPTHSNTNSSKSARDIPHKESKVKWSLPKASKTKGVTFDEVTEIESESEQEEESGSDEEDIQSLSEEDTEQPDDKAATKEGQYAYPHGIVKSSGKRKASHHQTRSFVSLSPSPPDFRASVGYMVGLFEDTVSKFVPMMREPRLEVFYTPPKHDLRLHYDKEEEEERREMRRPWPDLELILHNDPAYQHLLSSVQSHMDVEMETVEQYSSNYHQFCLMVDQSRHMKVDESMARSPWTTDDFNQVLAAHTEMVRRIKKMVMSRRVGMIQVKAEDFCSSCLPHPQKVVKEVHEKLPVIANKRNDDLLTIIKGASKRLDKFPDTVEEFVEHLSFLGRMSTELPALEKEYNIVHKLFTIARDYNVEVQPEDLALYKTLSPSFQHLKSTILYCEAKKDDNIRKFSSHLDTLIYNIHSKLMELKSRVQDPDLLHTDTMAVSALETIRNLQEEVQSLSVRARSYASYQERFGSSLSKTKKSYYGDLLMDKKSDASAQDIQMELSEIERDLTLRGLLWQSLVEWAHLVDEWTATAFDSVNVESLQKNVNKLTQTVYMLEKGLPHNEVVPRLKEKVMDFKQGMPVITSLRNPYLRQRHWDAIQRTINKVISREKSFTLGNLLDMNIFKHKEKIQDISTTASNEATLELMLQKIIDLWQTTDFRLVPHVGRDTLIIYGADDIMAQLEESQVTIATIRGSRYVGPIKAQVEEWERKLQVFARTLDEWLNCQRNWLYLEQIFSTPDIQRQLPSEYKMFSFVDKSWKDIMRRVEDRPNALRSAIAPGTLDTLQQANASLEKIHKCLEDYLETKRFVFPRFYFLSNDELLDILAQSKDPSAVQPHLGKCFGNIKQLEIQQLPRQPPTVISIMSAEQEIITMPRNIRARGPVEQWLGTVEAGMFETVKKHLKLGLADWTDTSLVNWVLKHPGQVVLTVTQIHFNKDVQAALDQIDKAATLIATRDNMVSQLNELAGLVLSPLIAFQRQSIEALLTITVHNRDIINTLIKQRVSKHSDFEWKKQLRYEWDETTNNCQVLQSNAAFQYGYEYLGCSPRLVITPLTDRCYLTLTGAMNLHLGGSPAGPAGTGKTETVKDLAKAVGKQCVVFNCSEGIDYKMLGKFFSGLAQSGSWCCFDEFNRIDIEVLSVVAQQILTIKTAKDSNLLRFMFEGRDIKLNATCAYFITMNPTYAGRVELPDNLKSLFRSVAMMVPDYALIAEIMLFSEGFVTAKSLSQKIVNLYQLASKQLSQQDHYDFGMRAIKSVLVMAGHGRRHAQLRNGHTTKQLTEEEESHVLIHSLRDANLPKFLAEDVPLFESILADLFPGVVPPEQDYGSLEKAISMAIRDLGLQHWSSQIEKVRQLHSQILVRHGVMLVGPTGGGKTTVRNVLQKALVLLPMLTPQEGVKSEPDARRHSVFLNRGKKGHVETFVVNPKCVKLGELYGETDPHTFEWSDGLIAAATRRFSKETAIRTTSAEDPKAARLASSETDASSSHLAHKAESASQDHGNMHSSAVENETERKELTEGPITDWRWIVLDGPVDTLWVENLNTVLDDSKVLCLASGERISLSSGMRLLFEVDNLSQASPATISRCAMVYMDPVDLGWRPFVKTWLSKLPRDMPESGKNHLQALFSHSIDKGLRFLQQHSRFLFIPTPENSIIACLCNILGAYIDFLSSHGGFGNPDKEDGQGLNPVTPDESHTPNKGSQLPNRGSQLPSGRSPHNKRRGAKRQVRMKEDEENLNDVHATKSDSSEAKKYFLQKHPGQLCNLMGKLFVFSFTWSMGGILHRQEDADEDEVVYRHSADGQEKNIDICHEFDNFVREIFEVEPPLGVRLPAGNKNIFSYFVDMETSNFVLWDVLVPSTKSLIEKGAVITIGETMGLAMQHPKGQDHEAKIVPTVDIVRFSFLTGLLVLKKHPVLLTGDSGVGKTAIINNMLKEMEKESGTTFKSGTVLGTVFNFSEKKSALLENISSLTQFGQESSDHVVDLLLGSDKSRITTGILSTTVQMSAQTSSQRLQSQIKLKLIKKGRDALGAPKGRKVVVFVDDLNMPAPEKFGAQPPLELLRQFLELGGFYDTKKLVWKDIVDVNIVAACGPPGGGRNPISPRLLKNFCLLALPQPSTRSLQHIYQVQLGRFFQEGEFMPEVLECLFPLVSAAIAVYYRMGSAMLPTPTKSHYTFNIRDVSKVIQGLMQASEAVIVGKESCAQLFAHEATRVFHDRLVSPQDRRTFFEILSDNLHDYFKVRWSADKLMNEAVLFGDFFEMDDATEQRIYRPMMDQTKLTRVLEDSYMRYNYGEKSTQLVFFHDAVEHVVRAARVFRQPGGHLLLVGLDGTGKSTVVHLASYIAHCEITRLKLHKHYDSSEFRDDLKTLFRQSGVKGINTVFLLADSDIVKESFLEDINCILNSGEVPDLFDNEELDGITMDLKASATEADVPDTRDAVYQFFIQRVRQHLHVTLTMSPAGDKFRQRCRMNPSLINCCTIDWYDEWSQEAMLSVAQVLFANTEFIANPQLDIEELKECVAHICVAVHKSVAETGPRYWQEMRRHYYATPSSYMEQIRLYARMLRDNKREFISNRNRLQVGLSTLSEANRMVGEMQEELVSLGPIIVAKAKDTEVLLEKLEKDQEAVEQVRQIVENEEAIMKRETEIVQNYADECQNDLASVLPVLQQAIASLETLDKASISEIRVYKTPPLLVETVMSAVCVLFQRKPDWPTATQMLRDPNFLKKLLQFDKNSVPSKVFTKLKKFSSVEDFKPDIVGKVSLACRSLCEWVLALEHYNDVYKMVKPKQARVEDAREALRLAQDSLANKQKSLKKIQKHLELIQQQYQDSVTQRDALKKRMVVTSQRLQRASVLISALEDEKGRWLQSVDVLDGKLEGLVGNTLVGAAAVAYLGPLTLKYRQELVDKWVTMCRENNVPITHNFQLTNIMADASQIMKWYNCGLPRDKHSTENAIFVKRARKWPLLIDPQAQGVSWVRQMEGQRLKTVTATDPNLMRTLETAVKVGDPVLIKEVGEELDPALRPIVMQETVRRGGQVVMKLGDTEIEYNSNFRLYMATSMANPNFLPAIFIQTNIINFTVTFDGLQEQLLSVVVKQERPQLESQREELLESIASDRQLLRDLEDKSLSLLQKTEGENEAERAGHILDDQDLVDTLQQSKGKNQEIYTRVQQSEETERKLNAARKKYLPVARRGAVLYFVLAELANMDVMYQYSLDWFQQMFASCIASPVTNTLQGDVSIISSTSSTFATGIFHPSSAHTIHSAEDFEKDTSLGTHSLPNDDEELQKHLHGMIERLTYSIYRIVSVGLFSSHQLTFSFLLCASIMRANAQGADNVKSMLTTSSRRPSHDKDKGGKHEQGKSSSPWKDQRDNASDGQASGMEQSRHSTPVRSSPGDMEEDFADKGDAEGCIEDIEWNIFLQGNVMVTLADEDLLQKHNGLTPIEQLEAEASSGDPNFHKQKRPPEWIAESNWRLCQLLNATLDQFTSLCRSLITCHQQWESFRTSEDCFLLMDVPFCLEETGESPEHGNVIAFEWHLLSRFQKLLLIRVLRSDALVASMASFVQEQLGEKYLSTGAFDLKEIYEGSTSKSPLIFILSPGCDPASQLLRFAKELRGSSLHLDMISLGRGQGPRAEELINKAQVLKGRWVFLQNCHLAASWMPRLQNIVENFNRATTDEVDPQFRLWLSSRPDSSFPVSILQTGIKMTVESPRGLKANMLKIFGSSGTGIITEHMYEERVKKPSWHTLLYGLCLFNAVIHERKKFGRLGWNIPYEFNDSDLEVAILKLQMLLESQEDVPWQALLYLTGEVCYGGRVTDDWDRRCLLNLLNKFYCPESLLPGYSYSSGQMYQPVPDSLPFSMVLSFVEELPVVDAPDIFGMTEISEKACRELQAFEIIHTLVDVQPRVSHGTSGSQKTDDEVVLELSSDILEQVPQTVETIQVETVASGTSQQKQMHLTVKGLVNRDINTKGLDKDKVNALYTAAQNILDGSALITVLRQEMDRFNNLLHVIHTTLRLLCLAIKGEIIMSDQLEETYKSILKQEVPPQWGAVAYESNKPLGTWVKDLECRVDFFSTWAEILCKAIEQQFRQATQQAGQQDVDISDPIRIQPNSFWLSAFFFPQGFLTAVLQNHARKVGVSIDSLEFNFHVKKPHLEIQELKRKNIYLVIHDAAFGRSSPPEDGVLVFGLYLDGANWNPELHCLQDQQTDHRFCAMPEIHFEPVAVRVTPETSAVRDDVEASTTETSSVFTYECPLYRTPARAGTLSSTGLSTNFVTAINIPSAQPPDFWILRGVAMMCQIDE